VFVNCLLAVMSCLNVECYWLDIWVMWYDVKNMSWVVKCLCWLNVNVCVICVECEFSWHAWCCWLVFNFTCEMWVGLWTILKCKLINVCVLSCFVGWMWMIASCVCWVVENVRRFGICELFRSWTIKYLWISCNKLFKCWMLLIVIWGMRYDVQKHELICGMWVVCVIYVKCELRCKICVKCELICEM
jgi:hypothetical protein